MGKKQAGFTLIEVLVVVIVIGILATIGVANYSGAQARARDTEREADARSLAQALELHVASNNAYPIEVTPTIFGVNVNRDMFKGPGETAENSVVSLGNNNDMAIPASVTRNSYLYIPFVNGPTASINNASCGSSAVAGVPCDSFAVVFFNEQSGEWRWFTSRNYPPPASRLTQIREALAGRGL
ncbi:MAG TPA: prepilin-type N-terminal cleavage/methylation domain-containing protein [Verrucomicrobiae bacterium]|nr:prepilin-type N-terminal cleavage/methylation domain-containing protein [Verrucomicrobiae bacterium]